MPACVLCGDRRRRLLPIAETRHTTSSWPVGQESNTIRIWLTPDGRNYVIDSIVPLEVGGDVCANPEGNPKSLSARRPPIGGFEVNAGGGDDEVSVAQVTIPVTMRGGEGNDMLSGGSGADKLIGGAGRRPARSAGAATTRSTAGPASTS